jgi:dephospho-CoA kinase
MRIAVTGGMRAGKDTFASYFIDTLGFEQFTFAEGIHEVIGRYFPDAYTQGKPRHHLQIVGQAFRELDPDIWVKSLDAELKKHYSWYPSPLQANVIVTDLRQPNEVKYLKENGFIIVRVDADLDTRIERAIQSGDQFNLSSFTHETEQHVQTLPVDYVVENNGTIEELLEKAKAVFHEVVTNGK